MAIASLILDWVFIAATFLAFVFIFAPEGWHHLFALKCAAIATVIYFIQEVLP